MAELLCLCRSQSPFDIQLRKNLQRLVTQSKDGNFSVFTYSVTTIAVLGTARPVICRPTGVTTTESISTSVVGAVNAPGKKSGVSTLRSRTHPSEGEPKECNDGRPHSVEGYRSV